MRNWLSCKRFCEEASKKMDTEVKWYTSPGYFFHYMICMTCRRYYSQIQAIESALHSCGRCGDQTEGLVAENEQLSSESKAKIRNAITNC